MTVAANLSNIVLNYIFIIRLQLAAQGAGLATMISQYVMVTVGLVLFLAQDERLAWSWRAVGSRSQLWSLMRLNWNILVRTLCLVLAFSLFTNFSSIMGTIVLAANSVLLRLFTLAAYMIDGAAFATESLAGIFRGQRSLPALRYVLRLSMIVGLAFTALVLGALFAAPQTLFGVLTSHGELIELATRYAPWLIPVLLFGALAFMYDGLFLGLTEGRVLRNAMLVSLFAGFLPLALAGLWSRNNHLLWSAMAVFMMLRAWTLWAASRKLMVRFSNWSTREPA
jgi:MATE family multidrug resistance protein